MASVARHLTPAVRELLAEAALRAEVGDEEFKRNEDFWRLEMKNELMALDARPLHVPSADAHDSTCAASTKYKALCRSLE